MKGRMEREGALLSFVGFFFNILWKKIERVFDWNLKLVESTPTNYMKAKANEWIFFLIQDKTKEIS